MKSRGGHVCRQEPIRLGLVCLAIGSLSGAPLSAQFVERSLERVYVRGALGYPINNYPPDTRRLLDDLATQSNLSRLPLALEVAVYWPFRNDRTVAGVLFGMTGENFTRGETSLDFTILQLTGSIRYYLLSTIGTGPFIRGGLGVAVAGISTTDGRERAESSGHAGVAIAAGAGVDFPFWSSTSIGIEFAASFRRLPGYETGKRGSADVFERGDYMSYVVAVGVLW